MADRYSTNMYELLFNVKQAIQDHVTPTKSLPSIKLVKIGPLVNPASFPFISVIPIQERFAGWRSSKLYNIRRFRVEVFSKKGDSKSAMRSSLGLMEQVKDIFQVNQFHHRLPDGKYRESVFDIEFVDSQMSQQATPFRNGFIHSAALEYDAHSIDEQFEVDEFINGSYASQTWKQADSKTIVDTIVKCLKEYKDGVDSIFGGVRSFKSFTLPPQSRYPIIFVGLEGETRSHAFTGRDQVDRTINIHVINKMIDKQKALKQNLTLAENCKQVMLANPSLAGYSVNTEFNSTTYGQLGEGAELLFGTALQFTTSSYELLPQGDDPIQ